MAMDAGPFHSLWHFDDCQSGDWLTRATGALAVLRELSGFIEAHIGHSVDEPGTYFVHTTWTDVGSYRRALSSTPSKLSVWPWLAGMRNEASAYESMYVVDTSSQTSFASSVDAT